MTTNATARPKPRKRTGRIEVLPDVLAGKPVVKGTRISVELVLKRLSQDLDVEGLLQAFPRLTEADIKACIEYAYAAVEGDVYIPETRANRKRPSER